MRIDDEKMTMHKRIWIVDKIVDRYCHATHTNYIQAFCLFWFALSVHNDKTRANIRFA